MMNFINNFINRKLAQRRMKTNHSGMPQRHYWREELWAQINQSKAIAILMMILLWAFSSLVMIVPKLQPYNYDFVINQKVQETIYADIDFFYEDTEKSEALRRVAEDSVQEYFLISQDKKARAIKDLRLFLNALGDRIDKIKQSQPYQPAANDEFAQFASGIPEKLLMEMVAVSADHVMPNQLLTDFEKILNRGILSDHDKRSILPEAKIRVVDDFGRELERTVEEIPDPQHAALKFMMESFKYNTGISIQQATDFTRPILGVIEKIIGPEGNLVRDTEHRKQIQRQVARQVKPVMREIKKNQAIVHRDQMVTPQIITTMEAYSKSYSEQVSEAGSYKHMVYYMYWCLLQVLFVVIYLYHIHPQVVRNNGNVMLCNSLLIVCILINFLTIEGFYQLGGRWSIPPELVNVAIPLGLCSALIAVTLGFRVALYLGFFVSALTEMMIGNQFNTALEGMLLCGITALAVRNADNYRSFFIRTMFSIILSFLCMGVVMNLILNDRSLQEIFWGLGLAAINGFFTATLALLMLFVMEMLFKVSTNMSLLMFDYNHPLLVELRKKAPGTFHHSLTVSTLVEAAAKEIHCNPIPGRVAALFHDIGKLGKPEYFAENIPAENKHDELTPRMSSMIIMNHVKAGLTLAAKYRLPRIIRQTIEQHHGTDMVYYFYRKAVDECQDGDVVEEQEFRYPGPLPADKSVVMVSLADACEAACRSIKKPTSAKIEQMVSDIFSKRIRDRQLDHADITVGDLSKVRDCFIRELISIHHARMAYPKEEVENDDKSFVAAGKEKTQTQTKFSGKTDLSIH